MLILRWSMNGRVAVLGVYSRKAAMINLGFFAGSFGASCASLFSVALLSGCLYRLSLKPDPRSRRLLRARHHRVLRVLSVTGQGWAPR